MSQKNIKVGLNKANVNAIAGAIGTATLNRLVPIFSTSVAYTKGQYTNYQNVLYRFTANKSAGAWDSTKVETASLNDLIDDVNEAVASVADKASVNGNYPTMTAGLADNLTPYGEDSGAEQDNPFISNGTGTNNNTEIVTVGDYGLFKEKQGNTLVVNQLVQNGDFESTSYWVANNSTFSVSNNIATVVPTGTNGQIYCNISTISGHKYLIGAQIKSTGGCTVSFVTSISGGRTDKVATSTFALTTNIINSGTTGTQTLVFFNSSDTSTPFDIKQVYCIDLTQMFNGDIPQDLLDNPDHFSWYYNGSLAYNTGSLENADGVKLVSTGRNIWDEEWEIGTINTTTGANSGDSTRIRSKSYIRVIPNRTYYYLDSVSSRGRACFYDKNKNFISSMPDFPPVENVRTFVVPSNACYMRFSTSPVYGSTYKNDITISLYYTPEQGGEGYNQYYPYEEPYVVDTGSEVLRKAGSVCDYKEPNGTIHRLVIKPNTLSFTYKANSSYSHLYKIGETTPINNGTLANNILNNKFSIITFNNAFLNGVVGIAVNDGGAIYVSFGLDSNYDTIEKANAWLSTSGMELQYALTEPTTEQGTPFAENLPINDYGMLYWLDSSDNLVGIPQGAKIFYPTNYKGFVDDMYSRVEGDSSQYVIQSELSASETQRDSIDTQLKNAIGGTLRQMLAISKSVDFNNTDVKDLGTLEWNRVLISGVYIFQATLNGILSSTATSNILCSKYKTTQVSAWASMSNKEVGKLGSNSSTIGIRDDTYTNRTDFTNAMKGVLLAYDKA